MSIGSSPARQQIGTVVGNVVFTLGLLLFGQLVATAFKYITKQKHWSEPFVVFATGHVSLVLFFGFAVNQNTRNR